MDRLIAAIVADVQSFRRRRVSFHLADRVANRAARASPWRRPPLRLETSHQQRFLAV